MKQVVYYKDERGKCPYLEWYNSLNKSIRQRVDLRIDRLKMGTLGIINNLHLTFMN